MIKREPYYDDDKDRWYVDKDANNEWTYVFDLTFELQMNNTTAASCEAIPGDARIAVLAGPTVQAPGNTLVKVKFTGPTAKIKPDDDDASLTIRTTCANGDKFDKTVWVKPVVD